MEMKYRWRGVVFCIRSVRHGKRFNGLNGRTLLCELNAARSRSERGAVLERELQQAMAAAQFQFSADIGAVRLDGPSADEQLRGNLPAGLLFRDKFQDAKLGFGQIVKPRLLRREQLGA